MTIEFVSAEKYTKGIIITVKLDAFTGSKVVPIDADLKVEGDILVAEIMEAYNPKPVPKPEEPVLLDVSKIILEVKTMEEALEAKEEDEKPIKASVNE